jgi:hypothetical protein
MCAEYIRNGKLYQEKLLSYFRAPFEYHRKVTCNETCLLLQNVFTSLQDKAEYFLEHLSLSAANNVEWFTLYTILGKTSHSRFSSPANALGTKTMSEFSHRYSNS